MTSGERDGIIDVVLGSNSGKLPKYIVLDIVFYGNSLNYDQGAGNYQELKKITRWDGRQYTMVSRYALRYSILQTMKQLNNIELLPGEKLTTDTGKGTNRSETKEKEERENTEKSEQKERVEKRAVIQPVPELLLTGEILKYPELDLFGYMITSTEPTNIRESPVKITHAVSLTPYMYDSHFNANLWLAKRYKEAHGEEMTPNPFTKEEHETYYLYTVVIDTEQIGEYTAYFKLEAIKNKSSIFNVYLNKNKKNSNYKIELLRNGEPLNWEKLQEGEVVEFKIKSPDDKEIISDYEAKVIKKEKKKKKNNVYEGIVYLKVTYKLSDEKMKSYEEMKKARIEQLIRAILNMNRGVKGEAGMHGVKLLIVGAYNDGPYKTFRADISLEHEYTEEVVEEKREGNKVTRTLRVNSNPVFVIRGLSGLATIEESLKPSLKVKIPGDSVKVYYHPSVRVRLE